MILKIYLIVINSIITNLKGKKKVKKVSGDITFKDVEFGYQAGKAPVLKNFNLHVKKGECIAFVGESGAGKTTILNFIIGFNNPTLGKIFLDGVDMSELDLRSYRKFIAVVPQNTILFSGTLRENITYGLTNVRDEKLKQIIEYSNIKEFIDKLPNGIDTQVGEHGGKLSGGQRQRIAIARALIRDPQIIMLDEATSALDNISELQVQRAMNNLIKGRTTFVVAHRLSTIRDADKIAVMNHGSCVEYGTYDELVAKHGEFYKLKQLQL